MNTLVPLLSLAHSSRQLQSDYIDPLCSFVAATDVSGYSSHWVCNKYGAPNSSIALWPGVTTSGGQVIALDFSFCNGLYGKTY